MKDYALALHIFRRDLRLEDNTALIAALEKAEAVIACFIFDKRQVGKNPYKSENAIQFMINSLSELSAELKNKGGKLYFFYGTAEVVLAKLLSSYEIDLVTVNEDYTPFSQQRDKNLRAVCAKKKVIFESYHDALLAVPGELLTASGKPYTIYTPFYKKARNFLPEKPAKNNYKNYYSKPIAFDKGDVFFKKVLKGDNKDIFVKGGRHEGLTLLGNIKNLVHYKQRRDFPAENYTSHLSAHNKFGTISIREFYHTAASRHSGAHQLIAELYWRDFFTQIAYYFPHVFKGAFQEKYNKISWSKSKKKFKAWCEGKTGFPIVDAGMRQLNKTGFMHNRVRMIAASFLVKDLHINWQWGERYFAQKLVDYDPAVNNGNWQWVASTGCDAQPYFRIFNPWMQQKKFDKECFYIKQWVPELKNVSPKEIHGLEKNDVPEGINYPSPMIDHAQASRYAKELYARIAKK